MSIPKVYFTNLRTTPSANLLDKMERVVKKAGIANVDFKKQFTAIKIHFGEPGNLAFIRPNYVARLVKLLESLGAKPYLTDSNTLYSGGRSNAVDHLRSASDNGFNLLTAKCVVVIADGVKGTDYREMPVVGGEYFETAKIGSAIADADIVITMNHFKGHEQTGFGGALKNLGMGCASVAGKMELHSASQPRIYSENCIGCNICVKHCAHDAIHLVERKAEIDYDKCIGCGQCVALCQYSAAMVGDDETSERLNHKIAEYTQAVLGDKPHFHISFIMNVSPECDCWNHNDAALIPDIGIAASFDPVALDMACADLVTQAPVLNGNRITDHHHECDHMEGEDKFHLVHPNTDWKAGLEHAEKLGVGSMEYELVRV